MSDVKVFGKIRQIFQALDFLASGDETALYFSDQGELLIGHGTTQYAEMVRAGRAFKMGITTAVAAVVAIPTTAHMYAIYNTQPDGGRSLIIDRIWAQNVVSTAVVCQAQLLALVGQVREALPTDATPASTRVQLNGMGGKDCSATSILTATALPAGTGLAGYWIPQGQSATKPSAVGTPGYGLSAEINGRIIVPPGRYFAVHVIANVVGETFVAGVEFHEKFLKLGQ